MNSQNINILEFPTNLGLKKTALADEPGVRKLPDWLRTNGFHRRINPQAVFRIEPPQYSMAVDPESSVRNAEKIIEYATAQADLLLEKLNEKSYQIILGGDCSVLIGTAVALRQKGAYGLFFLDGHTDFITPELSQTNGAAGMDLAIVTGYGHQKLTDIRNLGKYFAEENVFCVGNREYDADYVKPILESEIGYFDLQMLRKNGLEKTSNQFLELVEARKLDGYFIHLDVDVLDDRIMPAVDSRAEGGLTYQEFAELLVPLLASEKNVGIEITILDPTLDRSGKYTTGFIENFTNIWESAKQSPGLS